MTSDDMNEDRQEGDGPANNPAASESSSHIQAEMQASENTDGSHNALAKADRQDVVPSTDDSDATRALAPEEEKQLTAPARDADTAGEAGNANGTASGESKPSIPVPLARRVTRAPSRIEWDDSGVSRRSLLILMATALLLGGLIGSLLTRQRYRTRDIIVAVNGDVIDRNYFYHRMELAVGVPVMRNLIAEKLQLQYARQLGVMPGDAEVDAKFDKAASEPDFARMLDTTRQLPDDYKEHLQVELAQNGVIARGMQVTSEEIQRYYAANTSTTDPKARFYRPESVQIAVIVTDTEPQIQTANKEISDGNPFDLVARVYSVDDSRANGGIMPTVLRGRSGAASVPGLETTVFKMRVGEMTKPMQFAGKWWIIRCLDHTRARVQPFEEVADECRVGAAVAKGLATNGRQIRSQFEDFQKTANLQVFYPQYTDVVTLGRK